MFKLAHPLLILLYLLFSSSPVLAASKFPSPTYIQIESVNASSSHEAKYSPSNTLGSHWYFNKDLNRQSWITLNHAWVPKGEEGLEWIEYKLSRDEELSQVSVEIEHLRRFTIPPILSVELESGQKHPLVYPNSGNNPMSYSDKGKNVYVAKFETVKTRNIKIILDFSAGGTDMLGVSEVKAIANGIESYLVPNTLSDTEFAREELSRFNYMTPEKGVSIDFKNSYIWQDNSYIDSSSILLSEAENYCSSLKLAGLNSWQLPSLKELATLMHSEYYLKHMGNSAFFTSSVDRDNKPLLFAPANRAGKYETYPLSDERIDKYSVRCLSYSTNPISELSKGFQSEKVSGNIIWSDSRDYSPDLYRLRFLSLEEAFAFSLYVDSDKLPKNDSSLPVDLTATITLNKDEFETTEEFEKRKNNAEAERQKKIEDWKRENQGSELLEKVKLEALSRAFHIVYGRPFVSLEYDADSEVFNARIWSQFGNIEFQDSFNVPRNIAKKFKEKILDTRKVPSIELAVNGFSGSDISYIKIVELEKFLEVNKPKEKLKPAPKVEKPEAPKEAPSSVKREPVPAVDGSWFTGLLNAAGNWIISLLPDSLGKTLLSLIGIPTWAVGAFLGVVLLAGIGILYLLNRKYIILTKLLLKFFKKNERSQEKRPEGENLPKKKTEDEK